MTTTVVETPGPPPLRSPEPAPGVFTHRQIMVILGGLMMGILLAALDQTIVSAAIRTIADDLHGLDLQAWATTAYLITATISTPLYGKLSDLYGRKPLFLLAIVVFIVGSILCTISTSMYELAVFRAVQGLGAGGLMSLALAIIGDVVPPRERARYQGYFLAVFGSASVIGPLVGGGFAGASSILGIAGWRWVFLVNVPLAVAALIVVAKVLNIPHTRREHRIDWVGAIALTTCVVPLLLVAEQGRSWGWASALSITCFLVAAVGLVTFVLAERWIGDDALLPLRLFRTSVFSVTSGAGLIIGMGMFGGLILIPLYLQIVKGASPTESGLLVLPLMAGVMVGSVVSGQITARTGRYKILPVIGTALMTIALVVLYFRLGVDTSLWETDVYMALFGLGLGFCMQTLIIAVQNAVPARDMGVATASATFFRQMGGTMGVAVFLSILFSTVGSKIVEGFRASVGTVEFQAALADPAVRANPANRVVLQAVQNGGTSPNTGGVLQDSSFLQQMDPRLARPFLIGFSDAMDQVFLIAAGIMFLAFVIMLFLKEIPLRTQSGIEARAAELAAEAGVAPAPIPAAIGSEPAGLPAQHARSSIGVPNPPARAPIGPAVRAPIAAPGRSSFAPAVMAPIGPPATPAFVRDGAGPAPESALWRRRGQDKQDPVPAPVAAPAPVTAQRPAEPPAWPVVGEPAPSPTAASLAGAGPQHRPLIYGRVTEGGYSPLAGATLTLTDLSGRQLDRGSSDPEGNYRLGPPTGGSYLVICASAAHQPTAALVAVADGPVRHDIELYGAGASLSGRVVQAGTGRPAVGAVVTIVDLRGDVVGATTTEADGHFAFFALAQGHYTLTVAAASLQPVA
ncbi:MAG: MFS transporter, partial [Pseudonocardiaceae bacterium]